MFLWGDMTAPTKLVIRIAAITLASDSAITIARFRPSKVFGHLGFDPFHRGPKPLQSKYDSQKFSPVNDPPSSILVCDQAICTGSEDGV